MKITDKLLNTFHHLTITITEYSYYLKCIGISWLKSDILEMINETNWNCDQIKDIECIRHNSIYILKYSLIANCK